MNSVPEPTTDGLPPRRLPTEAGGCFVAGCSERHYARGLCRRHYRAAYYAANAERAKAHARRWHAEHPRRAGYPTVLGHPDRIPDADAAAGGVARGRSGSMEAGPVPSDRSARRATPRGRKTPTTGQEGG